MGALKRTGCLWLILWALGWSVGAAAETNLPAPAMTIDLATPSVMTGTLYEIGSNPQKILYKFRRAAVREGDRIQVEQTFTLPDGSVACRENIQYWNDQLTAYSMADVPADLQGSIVVEPNPKNPKKERVLLEQILGRSSGAKILNGVENLQTNLLICDTIYPFILSHWDELMRTTVKFHLISIDPPTTFGFKLVKERETVWRDHPVVIIKMEPSNLIIAQLIRPIHFTIEKAAPHRVFVYTGRITPREKINGSWKFLDAEMVLDWK